MSALSNPRHEAFAQAVASGMTAVAAYRSLPGSKAKAGSSEREVAARLLAKVGTRVGELQAASATATTLTMQERRKFLARCVRARLHEIDLSEDGDLVQEITDTEYGRKIKLPGKRECIMDDARLAGELIEKVDMTHKPPVTPEQVLAAVKRSPVLLALEASRIGQN